MRRPTTDGSAPNRRRQNPSLRTIASLDAPSTSSGPNSRPTAACTCSTSKKLLETVSPARRSGSCPPRIVGAFPPNTAMSVNVCVSTPIEVVGIRHTEPRKRAIGILRVEKDHVIRARERQLAQQDGVHHREHRRRRANRDRQRADHDGGEPGKSLPRPEPVPNVLA